MFRTAKKLGIKSVAVFSEADGNSLHSEMVRGNLPCRWTLLGRSGGTDWRSTKQGELPEHPQGDRRGQVHEGAGTSDSRGLFPRVSLFLNQAVHPGYGFLSENHTFAEELERAGITFIGPPVQALKDMGSKRFHSWLWSSVIHV